MATIETPGIQEETGQRNLFYFNQRMMYWQGWLPDGPGLDLQYLSPGLARLLVRLPRLRLSLRYFRFLYPRAMLTLMCCSCLVIHPVGIFTRWENKTDVIDNAFPMMVWFIIAVAIATCLLHKSKSRDLIIKQEILSSEDNLDNEFQKTQIRRLHSWGFLFTKYTQIVINFFAGLFVITGTLMKFLPQRQLYFRSWYPYDVTASPAYEITLAVTCVQVLCGFSLINTYILQAWSNLVIVGVLFKVLANKFLNIREIAVGRILDRKRGELARRSLHVRELLGREQQVSVHSAAAGGARPSSETGRVVTSWVIDVALQRSGVNVNLPGSLLDGHVTPVGVTRTWASSQPDRRASLSAPVEDEVGCTDEEVNREMKRVLKEFVNFHHELFRLNKEVHAAHEYIFLMLSGVNVLIYGGALLTVVLHPEFGLYEIIILITTFEAVTTFLLVNMCCNFITDQASSVGEAVYASDWLRASPSFKRSLLVIMTRTNRPLEFKPIGLDPLSLHNFGQITNIAYKVTTRMMSLMDK